MSPDDLPPDEGHHSDRKSLDVVQGPKRDFPELARDCVSFANAAGGRLFLGFEDGDDLPPPGQRLDAGLLDAIRKRVGELTVNVTVAPEARRASNGGDYVIVSVARAIGVASTTDGRYFIRAGSSRQPVLGDDVLRLANERPGLSWESLTALGVPVAAADPAKRVQWLAGIRGSDRVKGSVREKSDDELLVHYSLAGAGRLTHLGVLLMGTATDRARLGSAPVVQALRFDENGTRIGKHVWDDFTLSPIELVDAVWREVPEFRESYELPDGLFRRTIPAFEEAVVREVVVNALVHRPYTQRGDIFLNLHPDRLEVVNPGRLPLGVTPRNILHASRRRNEALARVFHDLKLMEREGSGFDLLYERLLANGRSAPTVSEGTDSVHVVIPRRVVHPGTLRLLAEVEKKLPVTQRERIVLALLAPVEGMTAEALVERLELPDATALRAWLRRLLDWGLVEQSARTRGARYFVNPALLRESGLEGRTTLARVQPHRLRALILEDLERFPDSAAPAIRRRIGVEIPERTFNRVLKAMVAQGRVLATGKTRARRYSAAADFGQER